MPENKTSRKEKQFGFVLNTTGDASGWCSLPTLRTREASQSSTPLRRTKTWKYTRSMRVLSFQNARHVNSPSTAADGCHDAEAKQEGKAHSGRAWLANHGRRLPPARRRRAYRMALHRNGRKGNPRSHGSELFPLRLLACRRLPLPS